MSLCGLRQTCFVMLTGKPSQWKCNVARDFVYTTIATQEKTHAWRPTIKRKRDISEKEERPGKHSVTKKGTMITCGICKEKGHNKKTCRKTFPNEGSSTKTSTKTGRKNQKEGARTKSNKQVHQDARC